jgi:hypothetical protein
MKPIAVEEVEEMLRREGSLPPGDAEEPAEPPRRVVELGPEHDAVFEGDPVNELWIYKAGASKPLKLPYFDPDGRTDEELIGKLGIYAKCS